jgi:hypothetical protein
MNSTPADLSGQLGLIPLADFFNKTMNSGWARRAAGLGADGKTKIFPWG